MTDMMPTAAQPSSAHTEYKVSARSRDGRRVLVTRIGSSACGVWLDVDSETNSVDLDKLHIPMIAPVMPRIYAAPWGAGKGIKGGAAALRGGF